MCDWVASDVRLGGGEVQLDVEVDHEHLHVSGPIHKAGLKEPRTKKYNIQQAVCQ
jgi:hypothetical protein